MGNYIHAVKIIPVYIPYIVLQPNIYSYIPMLSSPHVHAVIPVVMFGDKRTMLSS